jgi:hypothetical protein
MRKIVSGLISASVRTQPPNTYGLGPKGFERPRREPGFSFFWQPLPCEAAMRFSALRANPSAMDRAPFRSFFCSNVLINAMLLYASSARPYHLRFSPHSDSIIPWSKLPARRCALKFILHNYQTLDANLCLRRDGGTLQ